MDNGTITKEEGLYCAAQKFVIKFTSGGKPVFKISCKRDQSTIRGGVRKCPLDILVYKTENQTVFVFLKHASLDV